MRAVLLLTLPLALAACQQASEDTSAGPGAVEPSSAESEAQANTATAPASGTPAANAASTHTPPPVDGIPVALQGRWGMVPADCTSTRGDAKGLLTIAPTTLKFYESVGELVTIKERTDKSIRADFSFSGEGMTWTRDETLALSNDDKRLTRTERGGDEPGGPFVYKKCG